MWSSNKPLQSQLSSEVCRSLAGLGLDFGCDTLHWRWSLRCCSWCWMLGCSTPCALVSGAIADLLGSKPVEAETREQTSCLGSHSLSLRPVMAARWDSAQSQLGYWLSHFATVPCFFFFFLVISFELAGGLHLYIDNPISWTLCNIRFLAYLSLRCLCYKDLKKKCFIY